MFHDEKSAEVCHQHSVHSNPRAKDPTEISYDKFERKYLQDCKYYQIGTTGSIVDQPL